MLIIINTSLISYMPPERESEGRFLPGERREGERKGERSGRKERGRVGRGERKEVKRENT